MLLLSRRSIVAKAARNRAHGTPGMWKPTTRRESRTRTWRGLPEGYLLGELLRRENLARSIDGHGLDTVSLRFPARVPAW